MEYALDALLFALDYRGGDATGYVAVSDEEVEWQKASCKADEFYKERRALPYAPRSILVHTRMATQGSAAFPENNHPVRRGSVYVVHNGHVFNDREVFKKTNRQRYGSVDSEAIAAIIAKYGIMRTHEAMEEISGAAAIGVVDETRPGLMVLARGHSSPLMFHRNENVAVFASTKNAVQRAWKMLYGTAPKDKNIQDIDEGVALYLNGDVETKKFLPDGYSYGYIYNGRKYNSGYSATYEKSWSDNKSKAWEEEDDEDENGSWVPLTDEEKKELLRGHENGVILCQHGIVEDDCDICNPIETFLPIETKGTTCDMCNELVEGKINLVEDGDETWFFCDVCVDDISDALEDYTIHRQPLKENEYITL